MYAWNSRHSWHGKISTMTHRKLCIWGCVYRNAFVTSVCGLMSLCDDYYLWCKFSGFRTECWSLARECWSLAGLLLGFWTM
jgi:hypothetical protein